MFLRGTCNYSRLVATLKFAEKNSDAVTQISVEIRNVTV